MDIWRAVLGAKIEVKNSDRNNGQWGVKTDEKQQRWKNWNHIKLLAVKSFDRFNVPPNFIYVFINELYQRAPDISFDMHGAKNFRGSAEI